jgi:hypothetical protein
MLAVGAEGDLLSLRATGGVRLVSDAAGAMAWCDSRTGTSTVWHEGRAPVVVLAAPAQRVGGLLGVRECADAAGIAIAAESEPSTVPIACDPPAGDAHGALRETVCSSAAPVSWWRLGDSGASAARAPLPF